MYSRSVCFPPQTKMTDRLVSFWVVGESMPSWMCSLHGGSDTSFLVGRYLLAMNSSEARMNCYRRSLSREIGERRNYSTMPLLSHCFLSVRIVYSSSSASACCLRNPSSALVSMQTSKLVHAVVPACLRALIGASGNDSEAMEVS